MSSVVIDPRARGGHHRVVAVVIALEVARARKPLSGKAEPEADIAELYKRKRIKDKKGADQLWCVGVGIPGLGLATVHQTTLRFGGSSRRGVRLGIAAVAIVTGRG